MKIRKILVLFMLLCCIGSALVSEAGAISQDKDAYESQIAYQKFSFSWDDLKKTVQEFLGENEISIKYEGMMSTALGDIILLENDDGCYYVNLQTKKVEGALFLKSLENSNEVRLNEKNAQTVAENYANSKYKSFMRNNMQLISSVLLDHGDAGKEYNFVWCKILNGVITPDFVSISINPNNGNIISYQGIKRALDVDLDPEISEQDAIETAIEQFDEIESVITETQSAVIYNNQNEQCLAWVVSLTGKGSGDLFTRGGIVTVDAVTGEVVRVDPYL